MTYALAYGTKKSIPTEKIYSMGAVFTTHNFLCNS
jgi:hypothetical protein